MTSRHSSLHIIGHSRGTTIAVAMLASQPQFNSKVRLLTMLAPVVYLDGLSPFFKRLVDLFNTKFVDYVADVLTSGGPLFSNERGDIAYFVANPLVCSFGLCLGNPNHSYKEGNVWPPVGHHNESRLPVYATHVPAGTSYNDFKHYMQLEKTKKFAYYDLEDVEKNMRAYGTPKPPEYNLTQVQAKMVIVFSHYDCFVSVNDGRRVIKTFERNVYKDGAIELTQKDFVHLDFIWAVQAKEILYDKIIALMRSRDKEIQTERYTQHAPEVK